MTEQATAQLLPCPFCSSKALHYSNNDICNYFIFCLDCGCEGPTAEKRSAAKAAWNRRSALQSAEQGKDAEWVQVAMSLGVAVQEIHELRAELSKVQSECQSIGYTLKTKGGIDVIHDCAERLLAMQTKEQG